MSWRWDQGRLPYFQFEEIQKIAQGLLNFDHTPLPHGQQSDTLRTTLAEVTFLPFKPTTYKVWRNYKRVFGCQMLATEIDDKVYCTELCKTLASKAIDVDDYLVHVANYFSYPSPVFEGYDIVQPRVFPVCAIIKLLVAKKRAGATPVVSVDDVFDFLASNGVDGSENIQFYTELNKGVYHCVEDEDRQVRELMRFISQFSFLKWDRPNLILDVSSEEEINKILNALHPESGTRMLEPGAELLRIGSAARAGALGSITIEPFNILDQEFTEGRRVRVVHLRAERSPQLRELYFKHAKHPHTCSACGLDTKKKYPWVERIIELHHKLPLASPVRVEKDRTSIADVVGLCPTCHRAVHRYYGQWLKSQSIDDFRSELEAKQVYEQARGRIAQ